MNIKEWKTISCTLNGQVRELTVSPAARLSDVLREQGLISVKHGCSVGECGACTVLIDGIAVDTCLYLAIWADGKQIRTAEGEMKHGKPSAVQQAYADSGAVQCGFCTPGLIMMTTALLEKHKGQTLTIRQIRHGLAGNLCRCTGYQMVANATDKLQRNQ
ncbi:xanthine dehydrogenase iron sulfur-binding subunit XdhC [Morganella morganii]|nr:xanthine dehydrogenase iron sulfur-binding subunit XdhC [Morganella morganii]